MIIEPANRTLSVKEYYFSRKNKEIAALNAQRASKGLDPVINLGIGSPDGAPSASTITALQECAARPGTHGYQSYVGIPELREAMAAWYERWYGVTLDPASEIQPLMGSKEGILLLSLAFLNPGDKVLVPNPGYPTYTSATLMCEAQLLQYDLVEADGWYPDFDALELSLARGLNYYTGAIFEVKALDWVIGSICGGGRYDNLTGIFGLPGLSGVGISFGADRIYDVLTGLDLFPASLESSTRLLFAVMGADELRYVLPVARALREAGVAVEVYPETTKLRKQFEYAEKRTIPFISICGSSEIEASKVNIKNLSNGEQKAFEKTDLPGMLNFLN